MPDEKKPLKLGSEMRVIPLREEDRKPDLDALNDKLEKAHDDREAAMEVVVGAVRGLLECATYEDREAEDILRKLYRSCEDKALLDALDLFFDSLKKHREVSAEARAAISRQEG